MDLVRITDCQRIASLPASPGVYWLIALDSSLRPRTIPRLAGDDFAGLLYIGNTRMRTLRERVERDLVRGLIGLGELPEWVRIEHPAANEYWMCAEVRHRFPPSTLAVTVRPTPDQQSAELAELNVLANYRNQFGEYPPFNQAPGNWVKYHPNWKRHRGPYCYDPAYPAYHPWNSDG